MSETAITKTETPSWIQKFFERQKTSIERAPERSAGAYVRNGFSTLGHYGVAGSLGSILGAAHGRFGLDTRVGPVDAILAGLGFATAVAASGTHPHLADYADRAGSDAFAIFTFRKMFGLTSSSPMTGGTGSGGAPRAAKIAGEDPIDLAAKGI